MLTQTAIKRLIETGEIHKFYEDYYWRRLSKKIMAEQHGECQICKKRGKVTKAILVHHVLELKIHPELAYSRWQDEAKTKPQLIALCQNCHEEQHPNRFNQQRKEHFTNEEMW